MLGYGNTADIKEGTVLYHRIDGIKATVTKVDGDYFDVVYDKPMFGSHRDRKNDVPMLTVDQFQSDVVSPIRLVCNTASIAKTRMTTKRDKFVSTAAIALIKAAPIIRIPAIEDACDLFQDDGTN